MDKLQLRQLRLGRPVRFEARLAGRDARGVRVLLKGLAGTPEMEVTVVAQLPNPKLDEAPLMKSELRIGGRSLLCEGTPATLAVTRMTGFDDEPDLEMQVDARPFKLFSPEYVLHCARAGERVVLDGRQVHGYLRKKNVFTLTLRGSPGVKMTLPCVDNGLLFRPWSKVPPNIKGFWGKWFAWEEPLLFAPETCDAFFVERPLLPLFGVLLSIHAYWGLGIVFGQSSAGT